ncbi:hypothetical protein NEOC95_000077 [Neochlamydia sp. AcF95]|nr:hypothetical protein [Neochlamydia sp. AcF95]
MISDCLKCRSNLLFKLLPYLFAINLFFSSLLINFYFKRKAREALLAL